MIRGDDLDKLADISKDMGDLLLSVDGVTNVKDTMDTATPELKVTVDKTKAMQYGLTVSEVYDFIAKAISNSANATTLSQTGTDVIVIDGSSEDLSLADIQNLTMDVTDDDGNTDSVTIGSIATITEEEGPAIIYRDNQERYMTASAEVADGYNVGLVSKEVSELVAGYDLPSGYSVSVEGENSAINDTLHDLLLVMALSFLLMYLIMVAQFQSLLSPLIVMITVPLAFTGGFVALLVSGEDISVIAVIGFLLLSGVIVNNGIVLVDYINKLRKSGKTMTEAIVEGGRTRLRPIIMTATTTILGIVTLALGIGMGAEMIQPMAVVILGGMIYATFMTIFVVPALYDLLLRRKVDDIAESGLEIYANDEDERENYYMEKRLETGDNENGGEEEKETGFFKKFFAKHREARAAKTEEEMENGAETDGEAEDEAKPRRRFARRRSKQHKTEKKESRLNRLRRYLDGEDDEDDDAEERDDDYFGLKQAPGKHLFSDDIKTDNGKAEIEKAARDNEGFLMKKRKNTKD